MSDTLTTNTEIEQMEDGDWFVRIVDHPGVWASGLTRDAALDDLASVLRGWHEGWHPECSCDLVLPLGDTP